MMEICKDRLVSYFFQNHIPFETLSHRRVFTAQDLAAEEQVSGKYVAKVVMVSVDGQMIMLVLPATMQVDFDRLRELLPARRLALAEEHEFGHIFPDCEMGAMPPFGNLYHVPVYVDKALTHDERILFNAGTHTQTMRINYADYVRLVKPIVASFGMHQPQAEW